LIILQFLLPNIAADL